ncbi:nucleoside deaminase [Cellulophaga tyrosinoxydans]|uniref:tRNA(Arg) A34 adenosine deaminase TadA n=1 Tax=Cellulophaga tyrosinoxydans TaxID=504486 RepID=A0A1W2BI85_9FLAO|nr:nucleoside deaminase [Cellulophaga tyrosinoxydans]SMC72617.1 tRNA(Arg) A34 adenosine deaminase TadA [Cellulophaga tyrosinoxydans]|tara:strand:+ start:88 stop:564 length:477 start_codon:yes stop_codon:yes gene_type:complete
MTERDEFFMKRAIALAAEGMNANAGGPFGAVVVKDDEIIAEGYNKVTSTNDPTAHAEVVAIREACKKLNNFELTDCTIYTSCEPCPMCLGAIYWTRPKMVYFGCNREDAAAIQFDDQFIYDEIEKNIDGRQIKFVQLARKEALEVFNAWDAKVDKKEY